MNSLDEIIQRIETHAANAPETTPWEKALAPLLARGIRQYDEAPFFEREDFTPFMFRHYPAECADILQRFGRPEEDLKSYFLGIELMLFGLALADEE
jgi:hypothetical protein